MAANRMTVEQYRERTLKSWATRRANGTVPKPKHRKDGTFRKPGTGKYSNQRTKLDNMVFDSKAEAMRYAQLLEMQKQGKIAGLECQVPFPCHVNGKLITTYVADFRYRIHPGRLGQRTLIEDVKGVPTTEYRIKKKLVHALYPIEIIEIPVRKNGVDNFRLLTADEI